MPHPHPLAFYLRPARIPLPHCRRLKRSHRRRGDPFASQQSSGNADETVQNIDNFGSFAAPQNLVTGSFHKNIAFGSLLAVREPGISGREPDIVLVLLGL